ncbi:uncharacterized protein K489DRAFT_179626 [Dissoconium aciculare CBS 342.82]|uniref:HCNGP-domain-containing protein n=1 Tax=Dissoconium aciculare CBS 342.82 TaxID=1314786 RepID=A0A6J3M8J0_9PEZI|nr:uncharacterized protein K489DRAFT_179626 [Dissoconium aciculare CBS 342.82]KAF1824310.1 hypothetical protein K489DRAFT_179626 [Dissoconium aciculare CBS 342.82]
MPTNPSFLIPDAPPPPASNSEEALTLSQTTKKFERFLTLKKQNIHFNERLAKHPALENPGFLTNLMNVAGITLEQSYASSLAPESAVRTNWPESCFVEKLVWQNERREKKRLGERGKVDFVPSSSREL